MTAPEGATSIVHSPPLGGFIFTNDVAIPAVHRPTHENTTTTTTMIPTHTVAYFDTHHSSPPPPTIFSQVEELVGYGLGGLKAPSLARHSGKHVEADEYHKMMQQKNTVIIDVRNAYESDIGHFQPPPGGAELLDPKMRVSTDFPKWLNAPETKSKLQGKTVMMYCTGGIRCERATALLNQMTEAEAEGGFKTKEVVMARGGIER
jgi:rhodanese-related sulfurtransferase